MRHKLTVLKTPQQNGVAERMNHTIVETTGCMLAELEASLRVLGGSSINS